MCCLLLSDPGQPYLNHCGCAARLAGTASSTGICALCPKSHSFVRHLVRLLLLALPQPPLLLVVVLLLLVLAAALLLPLPLLQTPLQSPTSNMPMMQQSEYEPIKCPVGERGHHDIIQHTRHQHAARHVGRGQQRLCTLLQRP